MYLKKKNPRAYLCKQKECQAHGGLPLSDLIGRAYATEGKILRVIGQKLLSVNNVLRRQREETWRRDVTARELGPTMAGTQSVESIYHAVVM